MRNLDNQMMLYFSDKSLTFKLYYYILLKRKKRTRKNVETSYYTREIHTPSLNHKQSDGYHQHNGAQRRNRPSGAKHSHTHTHKHPQWRSYTLKTNQVNGYQLNYILLELLVCRKRKRNPPSLLV